MRDENYRARKKLSEIVTSRCKHTTTTKNAIGVMTYTLCVRNVEVKFIGARITRSLLPRMKNLSKRKLWRIAKTVTWHIAVSASKKEKNCVIGAEK